MLSARRKFDGQIVNACLTGCHDSGLYPRTDFQQDSESAHCVDLAYRLLKLRFGAFRVIRKPEPQSFKILLSRSSDAFEELDGKSSV